MNKKSSWIQLDCPNVEPRHLHTSILYQNYIISFGGLSFDSHSNKYLSHLSIFNTTTYQWLDTNPATKPQFSFTGKNPRARYGHAACLINQNQILIHGGVIDEEQTSEILLFTLDFTPERISINCEIISDEDEALQRRNHSAQVYGEYIYVFGGLISEDEEALNELWKLDLKTYTWTQCEHTGDIPSKRGRHASVVFGNKMYIFGGRSNIQPYTRTNDLFSLDFDTLKWTRIDCRGEIPSPRNGMGMIQNQGILYLFGGAASLEECCNDLYTMDLNGDFTWKTMDVSNKFPDTRANHTMIWYDNGFFVIEGANYEQTFNDLFYLKITQAQKPKVSGFQAEISQCFLDGKFADVTFIVEKETFPGHKAILTNRSAYFANLFKETDKKEIEIMDCNAKTFSGILEYLYCGKVEGMTRDLATDLWRLGNRWGERGIEEYCEGYLMRNISEEDIVSLGEIGIEMKSQRLIESVVDHVIMNIEEMNERGDLERISEEIMFDVMWKLQEKKKKCRCKENKLAG